MHIRHSQGIGQYNMKGIIMDEFTELKKNVKQLAADITEGKKDPNEIINTAKDVVYIVNREGKYLCADVVIRLEPSIFINTKDKDVEGQIGTDFIKEGYIDNIKLEETLEKTYRATLKN